MQKKYGETSIPMTSILSIYIFNFNNVELNNFDKFEVVG